MCDSITLTRAIKKINEINRLITLSGITLSILGNLKLGRVMQFYQERDIALLFECKVEEKKIQLRCLNLSEKKQMPKFEMDLQSFFILCQKRQMGQGHLFLFSFNIKRRVTGSQNQISEPQKWENLLQQNYFRIG